MVRRLPLFSQQSKAPMVKCLFGQSDSISEEMLFLFLLSKGMNNYLKPVNNKKKNKEERNLVLTP